MADPDPDPSPDPSPDPDADPTMMSGCHSIELHVVLAFIIVMYPFISDYTSSTYICNSVRQRPPNPYHSIHCSLPMCCRTML